jgi:uncharacterized damage-inducible protein DinB
MNGPLADVLRHNRWANLELLDACRGVDEATLDAHLPGISGPVRVLLTHIAGGQQTFVLRTRGRQHEGALSRTSAWPGFDAIAETMTASSDELISIAEALDVDSAVDLPYLGKSYQFPKSFFLVYAIEHGVEHRTEIKVALAQHGIPTPDLDGWSWGAAAGYGREV